MELSASTVPGPAASGPRAQLLLALLLAALMPMLLLNHPLPTHAIKLDLPLDSEASRAGAAPRLVHLSSIYIPVEPKDSARFHKLVVTPHDQVSLDGEAVTLVELRRRLDILNVSGMDWVDLRPDPNARYETFLLVLAIVRRASFERLRLDNSRFREAMDEGDSGLRSI